MRRVQAATLPAGLQSLAASFFNQSLEKVRWPAGLRTPSLSFFCQSTELVNLPEGLQDFSTSLMPHQWLLWWALRLQ